MILMVLNFEAAFNSSNLIHTYLVGTKLMVATLTKCQISICQQLSDLVESQLNTRLSLRGHSITMLT